MAGSANNGDDGMVSGINVTPLVDIMLVLLIIFMVTAKLIEHETIPVELPKAAVGGTLSAKSLTITITKDEKTTVTVSEEGKQLAEYKDVDDAALVQAVRGLSDPDKVPALISADKSATHGAVIHVLDLLKQNGITKFAFEIEKAT